MIPNSLREIIILQCFVGTDETENEESNGGRNNMGQNF
jgi:hypothetical protein